MSLSNTFDLVLKTYIEGHLEGIFLSYISHDLRHHTTHHYPSERLISLSSPCDDRLISPFRNLWEPFHLSRWLILSKTYDPFLKSLYQTPFQIRPLRPHHMYPTKEREPGAPYSHRKARLWCPRRGCRYSVFWRCQSCPGRLGDVDTRRLPGYLGAPTPGSWWWPGPGLAGPHTPSRLPSKKVLHSPTLIMRQWNI